MRQRRTLSLPALTAERLAKAAGVSRSTLFYEWPPGDLERRDAVAREAERFADEVRAWATTLRGRQDEKEDGGKVPALLGRASRLRAVPVPPAGTGRGAALRPATRPPVVARRQQEPRKPKRKDG